MKVAVITPYFRENPEILLQCHESVAAQTYPCTHFMIADGYPLESVADWPVQHIILPSAHSDNGNTPRSIGSICAINENFDALSFLDADNWYFPNHVEVLVNLHKKTGAVICTTSRTINRLDGSFMYVDENESDGRTHCDTSCMLLTREAYKLVSYWALMPKQLSPTCDSIIWSAITTRGLSHAHNPEPTLAFRSQYDVHYRNVGEQPPAGAKKVADHARKSNKWWRALQEKERRTWQIYFGSGQW